MNGWVDGLMKATLFKHEDITTWCYPMKQIQRRDPYLWPAERRSQLGHAGQGVRLKRLGQRNDGWMWQPSHWSPPLSIPPPIPPAPALFHTVLGLPFSEKHLVIFYSPSTKKKRKKNLHKCLQGKNAQTSYNGTQGCPSFKPRHPL